MGQTTVDALLLYAESTPQIEGIQRFLENYGVTIRAWSRETNSSGLPDPSVLVLLSGRGELSAPQITALESAAKASTPIFSVLLDTVAIRPSLPEHTRTFNLIEDNLREIDTLREAIVLASAPPNAAIEYLIRQFIDGSEVERHRALRRVQDGQLNKPLLAARLRQEIESSFGPGSEQAYASAIRDPKRISAVRSWLISALIWCEPETERTIDVIENRVMRVDPDRNVRFWILAGLYQRQVSYLSRIVEFALSTSQDEVRDLAAAIQRMDPTLVHVLQTKLRAPDFETIWAVLRILRIVPVVDLVQDVCGNLQRVVEGRSLAYDVLYALAPPPMAIAAAPILSESPGLEQLVNTIVTTAAASEDTVVEPFASVLRPFERARVRAALTPHLSEPLHARITQLLLREISRESPASEGPLRLAGYASDSSEHQVDMLGIREEAQVLAAIMLAIDVAPPLAIGLFGDWGSGKSFFMGQIRELISELAKRSAQATQPRLCANVVQIEFNAWHYVDTNLWASLVTSILEGLAAYVRPRATPAERHAEIMKQLESAKARTAEVELEKSRASEQLAEGEKKLADARKQRASKELELRDIRATDVGALLAANPEIKEFVSQALSEVGIPIAIKTAQDLQETVAEVRRTQGQVTTLISALTRQKNWELPLALVVSVLGGIPVIVFLLHHYATWIDKAIVSASAVFAEFAAIVGTFAVWVRKATDVVRQGLAKVEQAKEKVNDLVESKRSGESEEEKKLVAEVEELKANEAAAEAQLKAASARVVDIEARLQSFKDEHSLARFLSDRTSSDDYRKHLGLISLARRDFEALALRLSQQKLMGQDGRHVDRIILYIDDLDRCPAETVVSVLQAVHLLMAHSLFVVVVGVDSRWLSAALRSHYSSITAPQQYLEKIFQIPYALRPMSTPGFSRLITQLMCPPQVLEHQVPRPAITQGPPSAGTAISLASHRAITDAETPSQESDRPQQQPVRTRLVVVPEATAPISLAALEESLIIQSWEARFAESLHWLIPSPRAAKRLSNTYRILKARVRGGDLSTFEGSDVFPGEFQVPLLLLAFVINIPSGTAEWLASLKREAATQATVKDALLKVVTARQSPRLRPIVEEPTFPTSTTLLTEWIPHVARFSFDIAQLLSRENVKPDSGSEAPQP